jgi:glycosyltransferase involved in cell wall biosynthesis
MRDERNRSRKIGLFLDCTPPRGEFQVNQFVLDAVSALPPERFSVVVAYSSGLWSEYLKNYNLKTILVPGGFWGRAFCLGWTLLGLPMGLWRRICPLFHPLARAFLREKCDLWIFPSQNSRSYQIPVPALGSIHDLMHRYERSFPEASSRREYLYRERMFANVCRWAKGVLVDSEVGRQQVAESYGMPLERIHVLPFVAPPYIRETRTPPDFDSRYPLPAKFIFYPAQFWEHKNHKRLIKAVAGLKKDLPDLALVLAGSPKNAYDSVVRLIHDLGLTNDVHFLGYVPDAYMPELYRRARALVMPTFYGPTNIPPLEAFVVGCPVAISGIYAMPEQAGGAALLFNPTSVEEIADCVRRLWTDDRLCAELVANGKKQADTWGQKQFNERLLHIIDQVLGSIE